jgi:phospholipid/cholesterol/gamma-HCH transport system permease protein
LYLLLTGAAGALHLLAYAVRHAGALRVLPVRVSFLRTVRFAGIDTLGYVSLLALVTGGVVVTQVNAIAGTGGEMGAKALLWVVVRELAPLLAALVTLARVSPAVAVDLARMRQRGETAHLMRMGIPPSEYLAVPRVLGITLSVALLTVYFLAIAVFGGLAIGATLQDASFLELSGHFLSVAGIADLLLALLKGTLFGAALAAIACFEGAAGGLSEPEAAQAPIRAVMLGLLAIIGIDATLFVTASSLA